MIQNTSETSETLGRYTIPKLEATVEALNQNNQTPGDTNKVETLEDTDALRYLLNNGGKF